jgi:dTDP-3-amino-3,4,6-trideoxy-alpha-D-glucose transaminase
MPNIKTPRLAIEDSDSARWEGWKSSKVANLVTDHAFMIEFNNLALLHATLANEIETAIHRVLDRGWYILGPEVEAFEAAFARYHGVSHAIGVANGTDAIELALRAGGVGPGDEVITVAHTAVATVCAIERTGAIPILVDIDSSSCTMDPAAARAAVTSRTRALVPVHLYGHPAEMGALRELAGQYHLLIVEDCAQAHGARYNNRLVGTMGQMGAFSFYPTKNLGAYGDGGAVITNDMQLAERLRRLRNYGQTSRYHHRDRGVNSRLDEMQAAILGVKLLHLNEHNDARRRLADCYRNHLRGVELPTEENGFPGVHHVYHLYVIRHAQRDRLQESLRRRGIGTLIHYPVPIHRQPAYKDLGYGLGALPVTERVAGEILSLPMYVGLKPGDIATIAHAVCESLEEVSHAA